MENQEQKTKNQALSGLMWRFLERFGAQGVTFVVSIILARLLNPKVYGIVAIVTVFTTILNVFIDSGLGNALIQKKDADDLDYSSVFIINMFMCLVLYFILFACSPIIADFYNMPNLTAVLRVMSLTVVVSGIKNVQQAYVSKHLLFKRFFFATLGGTIGAAVLGIWMAFRGYGVWALVAQGLFNNCVDTLILWITVKWRPKLMFSFKRFRDLFSFGWKLLISSLITTLSNNLRQLIIGKLYSADSLAFYNRGYMIPNTFVGNIDSAIDSVLFPVMSGAQDDLGNVRAMTRRSICVSSYIMWPLMLGIAAVSKQFVLVFLTDKWLPCVPFIIIFCITYAFYPMQTANLNAIKAIGRSDIYLRLTMIKRIVSLVVLVATMWFGPLVMAMSIIVLTIIEQIINSWPNRKLLNYSYHQQILDIMPAVLLSTAMFWIVWSVQLLPLSSILLLAIQVVTGVIVYVGGSVVFKLESFLYIYQLSRDFIKIGKRA